MRCPFCGKLEDRVVDSRESRDSGTIRRRRECLGCGRRFTTYEKVEEIHYKVVKIDGTRQDFDRAKLFRGLEKACEKLSTEVPLHRHLRVGIPYVEIVEAAKAIGADMIVMGTTGKTGLEHFLLGSVAERIVRTASCPVLTVRHKAA